MSEPAADRTRILKILRGVRQTLTSEAFCLQRPAPLMSADLQLTSILLATGHREQWITSKEFLDITAAIWGAVFVEAERVRGGWLAKRLASDPQFAAALRSPALSAAMLGWGVRVQDCDDTPAVSRLALIGASAVARHPWIWWGGAPGEIAQALSLFLAAARPREGQPEDDLRRAESRWREMLQRGEALAALERAVLPADWHVLRESLERRELQAGDVLWQNTAGYCINVDAGERHGHGQVKVLWVSDPLKNHDIAAASAVPLGAVLDERWVTANQLPAPAIDALQAIVRETRIAFRPMETGLSAW